MISIIPAELSYSEIQERIKSFDKASFPSFNILILRNIMLEPIEPYLQYNSLGMGLNASIQFGSYDNIIQEVLSDENQELENSDCILVFLYLESFSPKIIRGFHGLTKQEITEEIDRIEKYVFDILSGIRSNSSALILWHGFNRPNYFTMGIADDQIENGQSETILKLNRDIKETVRSISNAYFVDMETCVTRIGYPKFFDDRYWHIGRAPFHREALQIIAEEDFKFIRAVKGKNKKCVVLDCDNTLWGGIVGEDGVQGIEIGKIYPGSAFLDFQQELLNLYQRGIILCLCSKNNEEDVWEVFKKRREMILKKEHIAAHQINWEDKATNIRKLADDLNIGLDSMVFIDDSEFEINLVKQAIPEIYCLQMDKSESVHYKNIIAACGLFDTVSFSNEDKNRGSMYRSEVKRKQLRKQTTNLNEYFKSLHMVLKVEFANKSSIPRISQLTQRTNQFNLTTKRYTEADIQSFSDNPDSDVFSIRLKDIYGDSGIVGICILNYNEMSALIDSFLLSCRVLGRGVEDAFIVQSITLAQNKGMENLIGIYISTAKNNQTQDFFTKHKFDKLNKTEDELKFILNLRNPDLKTPDYFEMIDSEIETI